MAQNNRTQPYGYWIHNGALAVHPEEMPRVIEIFQRYVQGHSYLTIANWLTEKQVPYLPNRITWNRNIIARILQNETYLGTDKYPAIISVELHNAAKRAVKPYTHTISPDVKMIKAKLVCDVCGASVTRRPKRNGSGRWLCTQDNTHLPTSLTDEAIVSGVTLLRNDLSEESIDTVCDTANTRTLPLKVIRAQNELHLLMGQAELKVQEIQQKILELAAMQYALCEESDYVERETLRKIKDSQEALDVSSLMDVVDKIKVSSIGITEIKLKSGKRIARKEANK